MTKMAVLKEWRCKAHGAFESTKKRCPSGCPESWVVQEIRTPPAYRRSGRMKWVDEQAKAIAKENGLSDMKADPKANISVLEAAKRSGQSRWVDVPHAAPGFSRDPNAKVPTVSGANFGTAHQAPFSVTQTPPPPPRPIFQGRPKD